MPDLQKQTQGTVDTYLLIIYTTLLTRHTTLSETSGCPLAASSEQLACFEPFKLVFKRKTLSCCHTVFYFEEKKIQHKFSQEDSLYLCVPSSLNQLIIGDFRFRFCHYLRLFNYFAAVKLYICSPPCLLSAVISVQICCE